MGQNKPFLLKPAGKNYIWGGNRLKTEYGKDLDYNPLAETWECSTHDDGLSLVSSGEFKGKTLKDVLKSHPDFLGSHPLKDGEGNIPILVKFIDARKVLSIQVHPDDEYARINENGSSGKTEMWYVLDSEEDSRIAFGFNHDMDIRSVRHALKTDTIEQHIQYVSANMDDVFFIEPGTVHAIGAGCLVVEIQQNSNITYRLYDYNRVDSEGHKRGLHIDKALEVLKYKSSAEPRQPLRVLKYRPGYASEFLCSCKYFCVERMMFNTNAFGNSVAFETDSLSFQILLCIDGFGTIKADNAEIPFKKGDCIFIPADSVKLNISGKATMINARC